jgi:DTW domain-containing protein YfiP
MKIEFSGQIFEKYLYFIKILLVGFFPCERTDRQSDTRTVRRTDTTKLIVAFRSFSNAPKMTKDSPTLSVLCFMLFYDDVISHITKHRRGD